jgi:chromosome segregation ATPase
MEFLKKWGLLILVILMAGGLGVLGYLYYETQQKTQAELSSITSEARKALEKTSTEISAERATTDQLAGIIDRQKELISGIEGELASWKEAHKQLDYRFVNLTRSYRRLSGDSTQLKTELGQVTTRFDELAKQNTANVANYNELSTKLSEAQAQFNQLSQRNTQLTGQINELTSTNRGLTGQVSEVNKQLSDLNRQAAESNRKAAEAAARVALLERQLADVREQLKNATAPAPK